MTGLVIGILIGLVAIGIETAFMLEAIQTRDGQIKRRNEALDAMHYDLTLLAQKEQEARQMLYQKQREITGLKKKIRELESCGVSGRNQH